MQKLGLELGRLKTGTPPRLERDSIDFSAFEPQAGDDEPMPFSYLNDYPADACALAAAAAAGELLDRRDQSGDS